MRNSNQSHSLCYTAGQSPVISERQHVSEAIHLIGKEALTEYIYILGPKNTLDLKKFAISFMAADIP